MGGAEHSLYRLIKGVIKDGHNVYLASPSSGKLKDLCLELGVNHIEYDFPKLKGISKIKLIKQIVSFLSKFLFSCYKNRITIVHSNTIRTRFYLMILGKFNKKIKTIAHIRDIQHNPYQNLLIENVDHTVVISEAVYESLSINTHYKDKTKVIKIYNGVEDLSSYVDKENVFEGLKFNKDNKFIGLIGRIEEWKRQDLFIEAALEILKKRNDCFFFIIGGCIKPEHLIFKEKLRQLIADNDRIYMIGHVENPFDYMKNLDLVVCPSRNEPFGRVIIEAMSLSKPVIGSNSGGIVEIIKSNRDKQLFNCGDKSDLVYKMEYFIENMDSIKNICISNYNDFKNNFSIESNIARTLELYK